MGCEDGQHEGNGKFCTNCGQGIAKKYVRVMWNVLTYNPIVLGHVRVNIMYR